MSASRTLNMQKLRFGCAALMAVTAGSLGAQTPARVQTFPLRDTTGLIAPSVKKVLVIGANEFSCLWKDRKVSVNYHESGPLRGDLVSVEVY